MNTPSSNPSANPYGNPSANPYGGSIETGGQINPQSQTKTIRRIDALSVGKMLGVLYAIIGLIAGVFLFLISVVGIAAGGTGGANMAAGIGGGALIMIMFPLLYGVGGFIGGIIMAALYNLCASFVGGIQFDLE